MKKVVFFFAVFLLPSAVFGQFRDHVNYVRFGWSASTGLIGYERMFPSNLSVAFGFFPTTDFEGNSSFGSVFGLNYYVPIGLSSWDWYAGAAFSTRRRNDYINDSSSLTDWLSWTGGVTGVRWVSGRFDVKVGFGYGALSHGYGGYGLLDVSVGFSVDW